MKHFHSVSIEKIKKKRVTSAPQRVYTHSQVASTLPCDVAKPSVVNTIGITSMLCPVQPAQRSTTVATALLPLAP